MPGMLRGTHKVSGGLMLYGSCRRICLCLFLGLILNSVLCATGSIEDEAQHEYLYPDSTLYICALDSTSLEASQDLISLSLIKSLARKLGTIQYRYRNDEELTAYSDMELDERIADAEDKLYKKRQSRDVLLFKGYKGWKYRKELQVLDKEIELLEENLEKSAEEDPLIHAKPRFLLAEDTVQGIFQSLKPDADRALFAKQKKADLLLHGSISDYYGRFYVHLQVYSAVQKKTLYEDSFLFSPEDQNDILNTMYQGLLPVLSGEQLSYVSVSTVPESSSISLDPYFAGVAPVSLLPVLPERLSLSAFAEKHKHFSADLDVAEGMEYKVSLELEPIVHNALNIVSEPGMSLYLNGVYQGTPPTMIQVPEDTYSSISIVDERDRKMSFVVPGNSGNIFIDEETFSTSELRVEDSRKQFYNAYGRLWIALPVAFLLGGVSSSYIDAANHSGDVDMRNAALTRYYVSAGAWVVAGCFLAESIYRIGRYVYTAERKSSLILEETD